MPWRAQEEKVWVEWAGIASEVMMMCKMELRRAVRHGTEDVMREAIRGTQMSVIGV